ncbi:hypothetical protein P4V41_07525 [Fictibacillus nanhaiensis]|uniref:hypothetical protein n=1 Tax=Fictibacillus nanhaiensis TaxID=742169 RepID=UPI002E1F1B43|nr:hypothetical protein [Fictibacillus nanhaiensis]
MKNVQVLTSEMKELEVVLEVKHAEKDTVHVCMYCWQPTATAYCESCETSTELQNDPFLNTSEELEYSVAVGS